MKVAGKLALGAALAIGAAQAYATSEPAGPGTFNSPTSGNGTLFLTLFSSNDATPYSYEFSTNFNYNDITSAWNTPGTTFTWNLTGLTVPAGVASTDLRFSVSAASNTGASRTAGTQLLALTTDPSVAAATMQAIDSSAVASAVTNAGSFISALNSFSTTNPKTTTNTTDPTYANANYGVGLNTFAFNAAGSVSSALPFWTLVNTGGTGTTATATKFAGVWTIDLVADTLTYAVGGGSVPLPAALWLFLSGLSGVGILGRRRRAVAA